MKIVSLFTLLILLISSQAFARNEWFTSRVVNGKPVPLSAEALQSPPPPMGDQPQNSAPLFAPPAALALASPVLLDLTMSIADDPAGDNNGNRQGQPNSAEQDKWERIIQHFSDAIFEMTEGAHKIRKVKIFKKGEFAKQADVVWTQKGHPHVLKGVGEPGGNVRMFNIFKDGAGEGIDYDMLNDEIGSGYTLAHEWGHYFYGLYDEYAKKGSPTDVSVSPSVMSSQWNARGGNFDWLNFSIKNNGGGPFQNTLFNNQHKTHGASCWESLVRLPANDPRVGSLGRRVHYPELSIVAPIGSNTPTIQLPSASARSDLNIIWAEDIIFELVIDNSGSMSGSALTNAITAAKLLVDRATVGSSKVGVVKFNTTASVVVPVTVIDSETTKNNIKSLINSISATGSTAIGDGALLGLSQIMGSTTADATTGVLFLLSDGESNSGTAPLAAIPSFQAAKVPIYSFAFGSGADSATLRQMAEQTGGKFYSSPNSLSEIALAFQDAFSAVTSSPVVGQGSLSVKPNKTVKNVFPVDVGLSSLKMYLFFNTGSAEVSLVSPNRVLFPPSSSITAGNQTTLVFDIDSPQPGNWTISSKNIGSTDAQIEYHIGGNSLPDTISLNAFSLEGTRIIFPAPVLVRASLVGSRPVIGASVSALATAQSGTTVPFRLADDGRAPDNIANDGTYSGYFYYTENGSYDIQVSMDNRRRNAKYSSKSLEFSPSTQGIGLRVEKDGLVGHSFSRSSRFSITTSGGRFSSSSQQLPSGTYTTLFGDLTQHQNSGALQLKLASRGAFSGRLFYEGASYALAGRLNPQGAIARNINRLGLPPLQIALAVDALNASDLVSGTLLDGNVRHSFSARRATFEQRSNPAPNAGTYTAAIFPSEDAASQGAPNGFGYFTLKVGTNGVSRLTGKLPENTGMTGSSYLTSSFNIPFYSSLYKKTGSFFADLSFRQLPGVGDFFSSAVWTKPPRSRDRLYSAGFTTNCDLVGSLFNRPPPGENALAFSDGNLQLSSGNLPFPLSIPISQSSSGRFTTLSPGDNAIRLSLSKTTGIISGSFRHPSSQKVTPFNGTTIQDQNAGGGYFLSDGVSGTFELGQLGTNGRFQRLDLSAINLPITIPDSNSVGIQSIIPVPNSGSIVSCNISLDITHTYRGDLIVTLFAPDNTPFVLHDSTGGSTDNLNLSDFEIPTAFGISSQGNWTLRVVDQAGGDVGALQSWSLHLLIR